MRSAYSPSRLRGQVPFVTPALRPRAAPTGGSSPRASPFLGSSEEYADLLELAGVDTVPALARRNAENLHKTLVGVAEANKNVVRRVPAATEVVKWVAAAKELPRVLSY